jgi:hypothetical protein
MFGKVIGTVRLWEAQPPNFNRSNEKMLTEI